MSNGIVKVKESDLEDATIEAEEIIKENYAFLKNKLTGFITSSSVGIEKYRKILIEEIKSIIAIEKSVKGLDKEVIKGKSVNSLFITFGPYEDPEIALTILIEGSASNQGLAIRAAHNVLKWYFDRTK